MMSMMESNRSLAHIEHIEQKDLLRLAALAAQVEADAALRHCTI
jgi:hypothetical protein